MSKFKVGDLVRWKPTGKVGRIIRPCNSFKDCWAINEDDYNSCAEGNLELVVEKENVEKQKHYTQFKIQPMAFIAMNGLDFLQGNVIKYVCRYKAKNGLEDLNKAKHYLEKLIELEQHGSITLPGA